MDKSTLKSAFTEAELLLGNIEYYQGVNTLDYGEWGIVDDPEFQMHGKGISEMLEYKGQIIFTWILDEDNMRYCPSSEAVGQLMDFAEDYGLSGDDIDDVLKDLKRK